jgi:hypothetical protein
LHRIGLRPWRGQVFEDSWYFRLRQRFVPELFDHENSDPVPDLDLDPIL